ncbi:hypothetical protein EAE99_008825 [Botrytis elliptica]|nr:hypothetical protein EAE99_008825 [Botrytis elliptica]
MRHNSKSLKNGANLVDAGTFIGHNSHRFVLNVIFYVLIRVRRNETRNGYHLGDLRFTSMDMRGTDNGGQEFGRPSRSRNIGGRIPSRRDHSFFSQKMTELMNEVRWLHDAE